MCTSIAMQRSMKFWGESHWQNLSDWQTGEGGVTAYFTTPDILDKMNLTSRINKPKLMDVLMYTIASTHKVLGHIPLAKPFQLTNWWVRRRNFFTAPYIIYKMNLTFWINKPIQVDRLINTSVSSHKVLGPSSLTKPSQLANWWRGGKCLCLEQQTSFTKEILHPELLHWNLWMPLSYTSASIHKVLRCIPMLEPSS